MEGLLSTFLKLIASWDKIFPQQRTGRRAKALSLGLFLALGRKTISRAIAALGRDQLDWSADYRVFNRCEWNEEQLFTPLLCRAVNQDKENIVCVAIDDTLLRKTGKKIMGTSWQRDPLSPPFQANLVWGMRYLQASLVLPLYRNKSTPARAIPVQFTAIPKVPRPKKNAPQEAWEKYRALTKTINSSTHFVTQVTKLRTQLDELGFQEKRLLASADGSYCNRTCLGAEIPNTDFIMRARKSYRLCHKSTDGSRKFYASQTFTPEEIRQSSEIRFQNSQIHYGGKWRKIRFKEVTRVYWRTATKRKPLRLIVLAPTPYKLNRHGRTYYRSPAYLLTTDLTTDAKILIQKYFDRWQIEVNFKEEKDLMGLGQQQVFSAKAVPRLPAFVVASYSALLLASVCAFKDRRDAKVFAELPRWRKRQSPRPSFLDLLTVLRQEIVTRSALHALLEIEPNEKKMVYRGAA